MVVMRQKAQRRVYRMAFWISLILAFYLFKQKLAIDERNLPDISAAMLRFTLEDTAEDEYKETGDDEFVDVVGNANSRSNSHGPPCHCKQVRLPGADIYEEELTREINWMDLTTSEYLARRHPNFPTTIMPSLMKNRCHLIPPPHDIPWSNKHWQMVQIEDTTYFLYSAFIDNRPLAERRPVVRVLSQILRLSSKVPWCYLWYNATGPPVISAVVLEKIYGSGKSKLEAIPYLLNCYVPQEEAHRKPLAVSVVEQPCMEASTLLEVIGSMERSEATAYRSGKPPNDGNSMSGMSAAACGTALFFYTDDNSFALVEWIEILRAIGFSKAYLHEQDVHPNMRKVLLHYEKEGFLEVTGHYHPKPHVNEPSMRKLWRATNFPLAFQDETIYFSDCILRHMHEYRFIAHVDPDEVPTMVTFDSYPSWLDAVLEKSVQMLSKKKRPLPSAYCLGWRYHVSDLPPSDANKDLPEYMWFLRHLKFPTEWVKGHSSNHKCLYDMDLVTAVSSHYPNLCLTDQCPGMFEANKSDAYLAHYNNYFKCGKQCLQPGGYTESPFLLRFKDQIEKAVTETLKTLKLV